MSLASTLFSAKIGSSTACLFCFFLIFSQELLAEKNQTQSIPSKQHFIHAKGSALVLNGQPIVLRGVNFANEYNEDLSAIDLLKSNHHSEIDYQRVKALGFNMIRLAFNGNWFEQNKNAFWKWLDQNLTWAKQYEIYLVLDLHVPIGGYWLDESVGKSNFSLWTNEKLQQRNIQLWKSIAKRYANEPIIAAYDILNEPVVTDDTGLQWKYFSQKISDAIRKHDQNHLIAVGRVYGVKGSYHNNAKQDQFLLNDQNVVYDFHFYHPAFYTHQYASWTAIPAQDGGTYPNFNILFQTDNAKLLSTTTEKHPAIIQGTSDWVEYVSKLVKIDNPHAKFALPFIAVRGELQGEVFFDNISVSEFDENGRFIQEIVADEISADTIWEWTHWSKPEDINADYQTKKVTSNGFHDKHSLYIANISTKNRIIGWHNEKLLFEVTPYYQYRVKGFMRGNNVKIHYDGTPIHVGFEMDLYGERVPGKASYHKLDKAFLEHQFNNYFQFSLNNNVPVSVMEFGVMRHTFEKRAKGGSAWINDMFKILNKHKISFAYWNYHGPNMGLYLSDAERIPSQPNLRLLSTLRRNLLVSN